MMLPRKSPRESETQVSEIKAIVEFKHPVLAELCQPTEPILCLLIQTQVVQEIWVLELSFSEDGDITGARFLDARKGRP